MGVVPVPALEFGVVEAARRSGQRPCEYQRRLITRLP